MNELPGDCDGRLPVRLALAPLPEVVVVQRRLALELGRRRKVQGPAQVGRPLLRYVVRLALEPNVPDWFLDGLMPAYLTMAAAFLNLPTSPISATIWAPSLWEMPGIVTISGSTSSSSPLTLFATSSAWPSTNSICWARSLIWKEKASAATVTPHEPFAAAELAPARPVEQARQRPDVDGGDLVGRGASLQEGLRALSENIGELDWDCFMDIRNRANERTAAHIPRAIGCRGTNAAAWYCNTAR